MYVKFVDLRRYQKRSKCKVNITFISHLHANTTGINICVCIIITSNANLGQIWSPKFASHLLQLQICVNPIFRPVVGPSGQDSTILPALDSQSGTAQGSAHILPAPGVSHMIMLLKSDFLMCFYPNFSSSD